MTAAVALPRLMRVGAGALGELPEMLEELGLSRPLVVTDAFQVETGRVATVLKGLAGRGMMARVFADTVPDPTAASVLAGIAFLEAGDHNCVVAIGGGSPIDTAKAIAVMGPHGGAPSRYKAPHVQSAPGLPIVAVPTTAGTGSEATRFTIITDEARTRRCCAPARPICPSRRWSTMSSPCPSRRD